jgi:hypothetical protein
LFWREEVVHEDGERIDAREFIIFHLFAHKLKQVIVTILLLFPIATAQLGTAKL